jgi:uncharacterized protein
MSERGVIDLARRTASRTARKAPKRSAARRGTQTAGRKQRGAAHPVVHFEISARDPRALHTFYSLLFGWTINADNPMGYGLVKAEGKGGIGGGIGSAEGGAFGVTFYVAVPNLDATLRKVGELGGRTVVPPTTIPNMVTYALFTDPQGNRIGLIKS